MIKITFMGAGSSVFAKNVLGDSMLADDLHNIDIALYDIDGVRLEESYQLITAMNEKLNEGRATVKKYLGIENRKEALRGADFVVNAIQVGLYDPCTIIDFEVPKKYGLRQTIGDTLGIGGIFRALRTIPVLRDFAEDIMEVCPNAWFLNYTNPMAMLSGYMQRFTDVKTIGLCHSVQVCVSELFEQLDINIEGGYIDKIAGINHMAWLLEITDMKGNDLYPLIKEKVNEKYAEGPHKNMVRFEYIKRFGYYCTESSEHNAEYNPFFIKSKYPELIERYDIPIDEYLRRCERCIERWNNQWAEIMNGGNVKHERSREYASRIIEAISCNKTYQIGGNVINRGLITNLPPAACVEVPCLVNGNGITPTVIGDLPTQLAAMNVTNINPQLLTIEAAVNKSKETLYQAAMLDPHTAAELSIDDIVSMCDDLLEAHKNAGFPCLV
ncbi:MAG: alpha-glucosidase/alpha-galactosidase [Clostridia bacterium]|nr:alpha-glucosidase/alpha-galactosidase [Clostridia bacterium]